MKKKCVLTAFFVFTVCLLQAQDDERSGLAVGLGGAVNYYYGPGSRNFDRFDNDRVNWQLDALLGFGLGRNKRGNRTLLAAFGTFGLNNRSTLRQILADQRYTTTALTQSALNNFYHLEGGLLVGEILRISTGVGQQNFTEQNLVSDEGVELNKEYLKYNSTTVGFNFNVSAVAVMINVNFAYGKDFNRTVLTPQAGIMFRF